MDKDKKLVKISKKKGGYYSKYNTDKITRYNRILDENYQLLIMPNQGRWNSFRLNSRITNFCESLNKILDVVYYFYVIEDYVKYYNIITILFVKITEVFNKFLTNIRNNQDLINLCRVTYNKLYNAFIWYSNQIFNKFKEEVNIAIRKMFNIHEPEICRNGLGKTYYCNPMNIKKIDPSSGNMNGYSIYSMPDVNNMKNIKQLLLLHTQLISFLYGYSLNFPEINKNFIDIKKRYTKYIEYLQTKNRTTYSSQARNRKLFNIRKITHQNQLNNGDRLKFIQTY